MKHNEKGYFSAKSRAFSATFVFSTAETIDDTTSIILKQIATTLEEFAIAHKTSILYNESINYNIIYT